jgi:hypothetical protein
MSENVKTIFVIMPFNESPKRNKTDLTAFFENQLKENLEKPFFKETYIVKRSKDDFNITEQIVKDIHKADIVICDLSGTESNPNVMYELGMRLSLTNKPVILIREENEKNKQIFDIGGFYTHPYNPFDYKPLVQHIIEKIKKFESGAEKYKSPILKVLENNTPLLQKTSAERAGELLALMLNSVIQYRHIFMYYLYQYLDYKKSNIDLGKNSRDLEEKLPKNFEQLKEIDLSEFHFQFFSQPTFEFYLSNQYLNDEDLVPVRMSVSFSLFLNAYYIFYFGTDISHFVWSAEKIKFFLTETIILNNMLDLLNKAVLIENLDIKNNLADELVKLRQSSNLFGQKMPNFES